MATSRKPTDTCGLALELIRRLKGCRSLLAVPFDNQAHSARFPPLEGLGPFSSCSIQRSDLFTELGLVNCHDCLLNRECRRTSLSRRSPAAQNRPSRPSFYKEGTSVSSVTERGSSGGAIATSGPLYRISGGELEFALEDLAGGAFGQLVEEPDDARVLVGGDRSLTKSAISSAAAARPRAGRRRRRSPRPTGRRERRPRRLRGRRDARRGPPRPRAG